MTFNGRGGLDNNFRASRSSAAPRSCAAAATHAASPDHLNRSGLEAQVRYLSRLAKSAQLAVRDRDAAIAQLEDRERASSEEHEQLNLKLAASRGAADLTEQSRAELFSLRADVASMREENLLLSGQLAKGDRRQKDFDVANAEQAAHNVALSKDLAGERDSRHTADAAASTKEHMNELLRYEVFETERKHERCQSRCAAHKSRIEELEEHADLEREEKAQLKAQALHLQAQCDAADVKLQAADEQSWRVCRLEADKTTARQDIQRLVHLLEATKHYREWADSWRAGGSDDEQGSSYVGPSSSFFDHHHDSPRRRSNASSPIRDRDLAMLAALRQTYGVEEGGPVVSDGEDDAWAPRRAVAAARDFLFQTAGVHDETVRVFLHQTNSAWRDRERRRAAALHAGYQGKLGDLSRKNQHALPYEKVVHENTTPRTLKKKRAKQVGPYSRSPSSSASSSPNKWYAENVRAMAAREALLMASLNAAEDLTHSRASSQPTTRL